MCICCSGCCNALHCVLRCGAVCVTESRRELPTQIAWLWGREIQRYSERFIQDMPDAYIGIWPLTPIFALHFFQKCMEKNLVNGHELIWKSWKQEWTSHKYWIHIILSSACEQKCEPNIIYTKKIKHTYTWMNLWVSDAHEHIDI